MQTIVNTTIMYIYIIAKREKTSTENEKLSNKDEDDSKLSSDSG